MWDKIFKIKKTIGFIRFFCRKKNREQSEISFIKSVSILMFEI